MRTQQNFCAHRLQKTRGDIGADGTNRQNAKTIQGHITMDLWCPDTNIFELLVLKHDRAYLSVHSEESIMCVIMKYNAVTRVAYYAKYGSISVILLTKLNSRKPTCSKNMRANIAKNQFWGKKKLYSLAKVWGQSHIRWTVLCWKLPLGTVA